MTLAAVALLALVGYTYAGYPLIIAALSRLFPHKPRVDDGWRPTVSVLCSVYNGAPFIEKKLATLSALDYPSDKIDFLIFDDGSSDASADLLEVQAATNSSLTVIRGTGRSGKPAALMALYERARGEVLLLTDIRQRLTQNTVRELVAALSDPGTACAGGTLELEGEVGAGAYWKYERWIRRSEARFRSAVGVSGSLYAIRASDFPTLPSDIILDDLFVPMTNRLAGKRVALVDSAIAFDKAAEDGREFGRKARTLAGNYQLFARMPKLLSPLHNPSWFELISHKVFRLLCPWAMIALLVLAALGAPTSNAWAALLGLQLLAYLAAFAGRWAGPLGKLARTFVVMNAAAIVGLWRFLRGHQQITW